MTHGRCEVHVFDVSMALAQVTQVEAVKGVTFHAYGIGATDELVSEAFHYSKNSVNAYELKTLTTIMADLGHAWVDVFKMDVEGAEYEALPAIVQHYQKIKRPIPITQAQIE